MSQRITLTISQIFSFVIITILVTSISVLAATGTTDAPNAPGLTSSYTLEDIYQRLVNGSDGTQSVFSEPAVAPGTGSMHDLNDIMAAAPESDTNGALENHVLDGKTFWGLTNGQWGEQTGNIPSGSDVTGADGAISFAIPDGYYAGRTATATDSDLLADNILTGVDIFGVIGNIPSGSDVTGANGLLTFSIPDGYYFSNTATATDSNLLPENIVEGVTIFGVTGTHNINKWSLHTTTAERNLIGSLSMLNDSYGWAGDLYGNMYLYNGSSWSREQTIGDPINSILMVSETEGWAGTSTGVIYHYTPSGWSSFTNNNGNGEILRMSMVNANNIWATGANGQIYHYNGAAWGVISTAEGTNLYTIDMLSLNDGWAVGANGYIYHYDGSSWTLHTTTVHGTTLYAFDMVSSTEGWAMDNASHIYYYDGTNWTFHSNATFSGAVSSIEMISANDGWAVTDDGMFAHYDGSTWRMDSYTYGGKYLITVDMLNSDDGWAVGADGIIYHYGN